MPTQQNLFIALSTGQNIANVLPILELAQAGDQVLWIESAYAARSGWSTGALKVLDAADALQLTVEGLDDDDPAAVYQRLRSHAAIGKAAQVYLIANGGTKLHMAAALRALEGRDVETLYQSDGACGLERVPADPNQPLSAEPYRRHRVDLPDILTCRGYALAANSGERVWPESDAAVHPARYARDAAYTAGRHDELWDWFGRRMPSDPQVGDGGAGDDDGSNASKPVHFDDACILLPDQVDKLRTAIDHRGANIGHARTVYHMVLKLADSAARARQRQREGLAPPAQIWDEFEQAALARLLDWLEGQPDLRDVLQSVWRDVKVTAAGSDSVVAQLDIALVLKNGILLSLECKSFNVQRKDIDARLAVLQRSTSQLAKLAVCAPWYTGFRNRPWFPAMEDVANRVRDWGQVELIPLTLRAQPETYVDERGQPWQVGSFEDALGRWLGRYVPAADD